MYCAKKGFKNKARALKVMDKINNDPCKDQVSDIKNVYKCDACSMWHLTSMDASIAGLINKTKEYRENVKKPSIEMLTGRIEYLKTAYRNATKFKSVLQIRKKKNNRR